jgi:DNA repair exonuclease SbcCD ATPase subunit
MSDYLKSSLAPAPGTKLTPNSTPDDVLGVVEILTLITDPAAHKKRLDDLHNATNDANRMIAEAKVASEKRRTAENMFAEAAKIMAERKTAAAKLDARTEDLDRREKDLIDREGKLNQRIKDHEAVSEERSKTLADRERAVADLEKSHAQKAQRITEGHEKLEKLKAEVKEFRAKFAGRP